jgi:hypothetical protein
MKFKLLVGQHATKEGTLPQVSTSLDDMKRIIADKKLTVLMPGGGSRESTLVDELMLDLDTVDSKKKALAILDDARQTRIYSAGDLIESDVDLCAKYNQYDPRTGVIISQKFERMEAMAPQNLTPDQIDEQIAELKARKDFLARQASGDPAAQVTINPTLASMSVRELQRLASEEEIDLHGATRREEILRVISQAQAAMASA